MWNTERINLLSNDIENGKSLKSILRDISIDSLLDINSGVPIFPFYLPNNGKIDVNMRSDNVPFQLTDSEMRNYILYYQNPIFLYEILKKNWPFREGDKELISTHEKLWIDNYYKNRFNLNISTSISETYKLSFFCAFHYLLFNNNKSIIVFSNFSYLGASDEEVNYFINKYYRIVPFYLKPGISMIKNNSILFDNNTKITILNYDKSKVYDADFVIIPDLDSIDNTDSIFVSMLSKSKTRMVVCTKKNICNSNSFSIFERLSILDYIREENLDSLIYNKNNI